MELNTKERILLEALKCFAENGYKGTNLRDLAARLGLSKSALYRHYTSKEDIWMAVMNQMDTYYNQRFGKAGNIPVCPKTLEEFEQTAFNQVSFTISDPNIILCRKILSQEQFNDAKTAKMASLHFLEGPKSIYKAMFEKMIEDGLFKENDLEMMALSFSSPISSLIHLSDRQIEKKDEVLEEIRQFIHYFVEINRK